MEEAVCARKDGHKSSTDDYGAKFDKDFAYYSKVAEYLFQKPAETLAMESRFYKRYENFRKRYEDFRKRWEDFRKKADEIRALSSRMSTLQEKVDFLARLDDMEREGNNISTEADEIAAQAEEIEASNRVRNELLLETTKRITAITDTLMSSR